MGNPTDTELVEVNKLSYRHSVLPGLTTLGNWNSSGCQSRILWAAANKEQTSIQQQDLLESGLSGPF